jgi:hypothetical protein
MKVALQYLFSYLYRREYKYVFVHMDAYMKAYVFMASGYMHSNSFLYTSVSATRKLCNVGRFIC